MNARLVVPGLLAIAAITVLVILTGGGGRGVVGGDTSSAGDTGMLTGDPLAEALSYLPARPAAVATVETALDRAPADAAQTLVASLPSDVRAALGIDGDDDGAPLAGAGATIAALAPLGGNPIVVAVPGGDGGGDGPAPSDDAGFLDRLPLAGEARVAWVTSSEDGLDAYLEGRRVAGQLERAGEERGHRVYRDRSGRALAARGAVLVVAPSLTDLRAAIELHLGEAEEGPGSLSTGALRDYFTGLPGPGEAVVRVSASRGALLRGFPGLETIARASTWSEGVGRVALGLAPTAQGVRVRFRLSTADADLAEDDLPIAAGEEGPEATSGDEEDTRVEVRDPGRTLAFLRGAVEAISPTTAARVDLVEGALARFARVDLLADLVRPLDGDAALTSDGESVTLRVRSSDPLGVADALGRARRVIGTRGLAGAGVEAEDLAVEQDDPDEDVFRLVRDGEPVLLVAVEGDEVVVTTDPFADLGSSLSPSPSFEEDEELPPLDDEGEPLLDEEDTGSGDDPGDDLGSAPLELDEDAPGALRGRLDAAAVGRVLGVILGLSEDDRDVVDALGGATIRAQASTSRVDGEITLALE